jgi:hypothetical protein
MGLPTAKPLSTDGFRALRAKDVFTLIHERNYWSSAESVSGTGSELRHTAALIAALPGLFRAHGITSLLDLPCGDLNWMKKVDLRGVRYVGGDIVEALITADRDRFRQRPELEFRVLDLLSDPLPTCDLVMVRDCLVHLSYADIHRALANIKASGARYLLTTTFPGLAANRDIITGDWRPINLEQAPFRLPPPALMIDERCQEADGRYSDKALGLWDLRAL